MEAIYLPKYLTKTPGVSPGIVGNSATEGRRQDVAMDNGFFFLQDGR